MPQVSGFFAAGVVAGRNRAAAASRYDSRSNPGLKLPGAKGKLPGIGAGRRGVSSKGSEVGSVADVETGSDSGALGSGDVAGGINDGLAVGCESSAARNPAAGRALTSASLRLSRTKSWT